MRSKSTNNQRQMKHYYLSPYVKICLPISSDATICREITTVLITVPNKTLSIPEHQQQENLELKHILES